jgi:voltage-gated potassium channel
LAVGSGKGFTGWRAEVAAALDGDHPRVGRAVVYTIYGMIAFSILAIGFETLPDLPPLWRNLLFGAEAIVVFLFTIEYLLRIVTAAKPLGYIFSFWGLIDLASFLPFYLAAGLDTRALRVFRLLRLLRLLKLVRYSVAAARIARAFRLVRDELIVFYVLAFLILYLCAIGIYFFEHDAQPEKFSSVFAAMWWAGITLTTVGYGDVYPITVGGRIFTVLILVLAFGVVAVPTGLFSSALSRVRAAEEEESGKDGGE